MRRHDVGASGSVIRAHDAVAWEGAVVASEVVTTDVVVFVLVAILEPVATAVGDGSIVSAVTTTSVIVMISAVHPLVSTTIAGTVTADVSADDGADDASPIRTRAETSNAGGWQGVRAVDASAGSVRDRLVCSLMVMSGIGHMGEPVEASRLSTGVAGDL